MKTIETQIVINATPARVWQVLTNFENHPNWNPFIRKISGPKRTGAALEVLLGSPDQKPMKFTPLVLAFEENVQFRWKGQLFFKGIFDGEHYFILEETPEKNTLFTHGEIFGGILVSLVGGMLKKTELGFEAMNMALKKECEKAM